MKRSILVFVLGALLLPDPAAWADAAPPAEDVTFGRRLQFAISAERLFGLDRATQTQTLGGSFVESQSTTMAASLLGTPAPGIASAFTVPRLAVDLFVWRDLTVGAAAGYFTSTVTISESGGAFDVSTSGYVLAPRVGYAVRITPRLSIWPRAGISFVHDRSKSGKEFLTTLKTATVDIPVVFIVVPHVALSIAPTLDTSFSGTFEDVANGVYEQKTTDIGLQAGLLLFL